MQDEQLLYEGITLMALGMGFVFVFLTLLVGITTLMSKLIGRFFPEPAAPATPSRGAPGSRRDDNLVVAISAAVHRYRRRHHRR